MTPDTLVIQRGRKLFSVPRSEISNFEVSLRQRRNTMKGLAVGLALNAFLWGAVASRRLNLSLAPTSTKGLRAALTFNF